MILDQANEVFVVPVVQCSLRNLVYGQFTVITVVLT